MNEAGKPPPGSSGFPSGKAIPSVSFHRHDVSAAELFRQEEMPNPTRRSLTELRCHRRLPLAGARTLARRSLSLMPLLALAITLNSCNKKPASPSGTTPAAPAQAPPAGLPLARQLAAARLEVAKTCLEKNSQDEALALLVAACNADPTFTAATTLMRQLLAQTVWNIPVASLNNPLPVEQLAFVAPASLWVSLAEGTPDGFNTTVRWNTEALKIEGVLFPARGVMTHSLVVSQSPRSLVVQRGSGPTAVTLLCDASSLHATCDLGPLPPNLTPQAVIATSANGLLVAHPGPLSATDPRLVWRIRDAATGEVICSSDPLSADAARPLAAQLDSQRLRVLHADGSLLELPVSPVETARNFPSALPLALLHAQFRPDGAEFLALVDRGPDQPPVHRLYQINGEPGTADPHLEAAAGSKILSRAELPEWVLRLPWSTQPSVWTSLLRDHGNPDEPSPIHVQGSDLRFAGSHRVPIHSEAPITAVAFGPDLAIIGTATGSVVMQRFLPLPQASAEPPQAAEPIDPARLGLFAEILSGVRFDEVGATFIRLSAAQRFSLLEDIRTEQAATLVPGLDFTATLAGLKAVVPRAAPAASLLPMWDRLARSDRSAKAWPRLLDMARPLADTRWHQDLSEAAALRAEPAPPAQAISPDDPSPWRAQLRIREAFARHDEAAILSEIQAAGTRGPAAATALALALDAESPEWIDACLKTASDLPPLLRTLGESRIAWLQKRNADAMSLWPDEFPDFVKTRQAEDWDGWEQEDFAPRYAAHLQVLTGELAAYVVAADATPPERAAAAERLLAPAARSIIGRRRLAENSLKAAVALAVFPENSAATFQLASQARALGAQPEPCLRAEAISLTRLGDYKNAHPRWLTLLTEHPVATHLSNDYAEAAYTAFENEDPAQALEILSTGVNRFPNDANFALRAGWIALLTGNGGRAYQFLQAGLRVGYPDDKRENASLLLAVAAAQAGFPEDAAMHFQDLLDLAPVWAETKTIDALEWPEELKTSLYQLAQ